MKNNYFKPITVFLIVVALTFLICVKANNNFSVLENGQVFSPNKNKIYSLEGYKWDSNTKRYSFDIVVEDTHQPLSLIYGFIPNDIYVNEDIIANSVDFNYSTFSNIPIDSSWYDKETNTFNLGFYSESIPYNLPLYISTANSAASAILIYYMTFSFNLGITFLMSLYGLSLYLYKRSEKYLIWFSIYTGALTLWSISSILLDMNYNFIQKPVAHAYGWCVLLDVVICFKMFNTKLPGRFNWLLSRNGVITLLLAWATFENLLPSTFKDYYFLFFVSIAALIYACSKKRKGAWMLLVGHTISLGMRLVIVFSPVLMTQISFWLRAMRYSKLFNLPFAICCLFLINSLFAEKFLESEALAMQLEQTNKMLDKRVADRTQALKEQQKQRNSFIVNIFHDLRTPLFILKGSTEKIKAQPHVLSQELPVIEERLNFVQHLVDDLFLMEKLEYKQVILETERVPLGKLLGRVVKACRLPSEEKDIIMMYNIDNDCVTWGDEYRLEQAFQNLIINAIYYTKPGGTVYVKLNPHDKIAFISIHDTGVGISQEDQDKIFDRYYRVSGTEKHKSTGLGLSIAQEIIRQHQGNIKVESYLGKGTVFTVQLPIIL